MKKAIITIAILAALSGQAIAQERTTPTEVKNTPIVKIDPTANVVKTNTASNMIQLWSIWSQSVPNNGELSSDAFDTTGYKEMRIMIFTDGHCTSANLIVQVERVAFNNSLVVGSANFAAPAHPITEQGNFVQTPGICMFSIPIYGNSYRIKIQNNTGSALLIFNPSSVYLVN